MSPLHQMQNIISATFLLQRSVYIQSNKWKDGGFNHELIYGTAYVPYIKI